MNFIISSTQINLQKLADISFQMKEIVVKELYCYVEESTTVIESASHLAFLNGYVCDFNFSKEEVLPQYHSAIEKIENNWPVSEDISGSFALAMIRKKDATVTFCNDAVGIYPLYYLIDEPNFYISSNLPLMALFQNSEIDEVGVAQRSLGKELSNLGSRTILKQVHRLLPGEHIQINHITNTVSKRYDNLLYGNITHKKPKLSKKNYDNYWNVYTKEMSYLLAQHDQKPINIALSGGMDSRIVLGSLPDQTKAKCLTFGPSDSYEVNVAKRLAKTQNHDFESFSNLDLYFPEKQLLQEYALKTEPINIAGWLEILENPATKNRPLLLIGDACEVLPARNIKSLSSRKSRINNFLKTIVFKSDYQLKKNTPQHFKTWRASIIKSELKVFTDQKLEDLDLMAEHETIRDCIIEDIQQLINRIEAHNLPFIELCEELYTWFTHGRLPIGKQTAICNRAFTAVNPSLSVGILRHSSNIHPNHRLNYRFMNQLFKTQKKLRQLNKIPISQIPLIPHNYPNALLFLFWGFRSRVDQLLIQRILKKKNPNLRYRLFKCLNWVSVYQHEDLEKRMKSYYTPNHLGDSFYQKNYNDAMGRKALTKWPLANIDLLARGSLNLEIDAIKNINNAV